MRRLALFLAAVTALLTSLSPHRPMIRIRRSSKFRKSLSSAKGQSRPLPSSSSRTKKFFSSRKGRPAQVLRLIPGFLAVEHSGGAGKADQYFLRGFDADHGTDVAFFVDEHAD